MSINLSTSSPADIDKSTRDSSLVYSSQTRVPELDGLRGIAILLVMFSHFSVDFPPTLAGLFSLGGQAPRGVDLFFVLSGFLITGILLDTRGTPRYLTTFYMRRTLRIFPIYFLTLAVFTWVLPAFLHSPNSQGNSGGLHALIDRFSVWAPWFWTYTTNFKMIAVGVWGSPGHFWTLAIEEQFYLLWPLIVLIAGPKYLAKVCLACIGVAVGLRLMSQVFFADEQQQFFFAHTLMFCRMDCLAIGALMVIFLRDPRTVLRTMNWAYFLLPLAVLYAGALMVSGYQSVAAGDYSENWSGWHAIGWTADYLIVGMCSAILIVATLTPRHRWLQKFMAWKPLITFGAYSYAMYILHPFVRHVFKQMGLLGKLRKTIGYEVPAELIYMCVAMGSTLLAGWISWYAFEKHFMSLKRYFKYQTAPQTADISLSPVPQPIPSENKQIASS